MKQLLVCDHISKKAGTFLLQDIHFTLEPGYIMAVIGSNGAGKSTLVRSLLGSYKLYDHVNDYPDPVPAAKSLSANKGDIYIEGHSIKYDSKAYKERVAFVMCECPFTMKLSAKDNGLLYGSYYKNFNQKRYEQLCKEFALPPKNPIGKFSKGQQIKMQLAFAMAREASVYVMDEPAGNLDVKFREEFYDIMRNLVREGDKSIIYVTHLVEEAEIFADYVLWIEDGKQIWTGTLECLLDEYRLYVGDLQPLYREMNIQVVSTKENAVHKEALVRCIKGDFSDFIEANSRRATLKEIMYYEKEGKVARKNGNG